MILRKNIGYYWIKLRVKLEQHQLEMWQNISGRLQQLNPASWRKEHLEMFLIASWRPTVTLTLTSCLACICQIMQGLGYLVRPLAREHGCTASQCELDLIYDVATVTLDYKILIDKTILHKSQVWMFTFGQDIDQGAGVQYPGVPWGSLLTF